MTRIDKLAERQAVEHESRLKHIDELLKQAEQAGDEASKAELEELEEKQTAMGDYIERLREESPEQFMQTAGPMVMWELVAQRLEKLVEKIKT
ncbi:MAG TPA: hypothetical protein VIM41_06155 [Gammaproteobacteria bacterium]